MSTKTKDTSSYPWYLTEAEAELLRKKFGEAITITIRHKPPNPARRPRDPIRKKVGIHNTGATCYINSALQMLYSCTPLRRLLSEPTEESSSAPVHDVESSSSEPAYDVDSPSDAESSSAYDVASASSQGDDEEPSKVELSDAESSDVEVVVIRKPALPFTNNTEVRKRVIWLLKNIMDAMDKGDDYRSVLKKSLWIRELESKFSAFSKQRSGRQQDAEEFFFFVGSCLQDEKTIGVALYKHVFRLACSSLDKTKRMEWRTIDNEDYCLRLGVGGSLPPAPASISIADLLEEDFLKIEYNESADGCLGESWGAQFPLLSQRTDILPGGEQEVFFVQRKREHNSEEEAVREVAATYILKVKGVDFFLQGACVYTGEGLHGHWMYYDFSHASPVAEETTIPGTVYNDNEVEKKDFLVSSNAVEIKDRSEATFCMANRGFLFMYDRDKQQTARRADH